MSENARVQHTRRESVPEQLFEPAAVLDEQIQMYARVDTHLVQHVDQVERTNVPGRAGSERAAAHATERCRKLDDLSVHCGEHVREREASCVVKVKLEANTGKFALQCLTQRIYLRRVGYADRVSDFDAPHA